MWILRKHGNYLEESIAFAPNTNISIAIISIIEYYPIFILSFISATNIKKFIYNEILSNDSLSKSNYYKASLLYFILPDISNKALSQTNFIIFLLVVLCFIILFIMYIIIPDRSLQTQLSKLDKSKKSSSIDTSKKWSKYYNIIIVWFYDFLFFRIFSFGICLIVSNAVLGACYYENSSFFVLFLGFIIGLLYFIVSIFYFKFTYCYLKIDKNANNYPYDNFSSQYELVMFIIKIAMALNINSFFIYENNLLWSWSTVIMILIPISYSIFLLYNLYVSKSYMIFYRNESLNFFRLFLLNFMCFNIIVHIFFFYSHSNIFIALYFLSITLFSFSMTYFICKFQFDKIITGKELLYKLFYLIEAYTNNNMDYYERILKEISVVHFNRCHKEIKFCPVCSFFMKKNSNDIIEIAELIYNLVENKKEERAMMIESFLMIHSTKSNMYLMNLFYSKRIEFLYRKYPILSMNMLYYFKRILNKDLNTIHQVQSIQLLENQSKNIKTFLDVLKDIVTGVEKHPQFLITSSRKLHLLKDELKHKLLSKNENSLDYQVIITKYIYVTVLNSKIQKGTNEFNISYYDDILQEHFCNDKFFLFNYEMTTNTITIIRASREYCKHISEQFDSLFPFKDIGKEKLLEVLNKRIDSNIINNVFEYPIKDPEHSDYISTFKMNFKIFPSIDLSSFLMISFYQNKYANVLVTLKENMLKDEKIITFNTNLKDIMILSPGMINVLNAYKKEIFFKDIFYEKFKTISTENETRIKEIGINYKKYLPIIKQKLNFYFETESNSKEEKESYYTAYNKESIRIKNTKEKKSIELLSESEFTSKANSHCIVKIYYLRKESGKGTNCMRDMNGCLPMNNLKMFTTISGGKTEYLSRAIMNSTSSFTKNHSSSGKIKSLQGNIDINKRNQNNQKSNKAQNKKFTFFTILILIYNSILILLTIIFLILAIKENKVFTDSFSFFQQWHKYFRLFMNSTLSFFFTLCPAKPNTNECEFKYNLYALDFNVNYGLDKRIDVMMYLSEELIIKVNYYQTLLFELKSHIYKHNDAELIKIAEKEMINYSFSEVNGKYTVVYKNVSFFDNLNIYFNELNAIANDLDFIYVPMQILAKLENGKLNMTMMHIDPGEEIKLNAYSIMINYRKILALTEEMTDEITNNLLDSISECKFIGNFFCIFLIINHILLLVICLCMVKMFKNILFSFTSEIKATLAEPSIVDRLKNKITIMLSLVEFYKENPNKLSAQYDKIKSESNSKAKMTQKEQNESTPLLTSNTIHNDEPISNLLSILLPSIHIIILLFLIYFIFSISYFLFLKTTLNTYSSIITTFSTNSEIDSNVYAVSTVFQVMIFTNQTDIEMQEFYGNEKPTEGYIAERIKKAYANLYYVEKEESFRQNKITPLRDIINLSCDTLLNNVDDQILHDMSSLFADKYKDINLYNELAKICKYYDFMEYKNDKIFIREILFRAMELNNALVHSIDNLYQINISRKLFDIYLFILLFYRPLRHFESSSIYLNVINNTTDTYNIVIYTFLVIHTIFEILLFILLRKFVVNEYLYTNKSLNMLTKCLKV